MVNTSVRKTGGGNVSPVSYTHLDVYKRQALDDRILHSSYRKAEHALSKKTSNDTDAEGNSGNYQKRWLNHWS